MPIPNQVVRCSILWQVNLTDWPGESAVNTFHLAAQAGPTAPAPNPQYIADQVAAKLTAAWSGISAIWPNPVQVSAIRTYLLDGTGHTTAEGSHSFTSGTLVGSGTSGSLPPEVAMCLSLYSYAPGGFAPQKGRRRGRMYLGPLSQGLCTTAGKVNMSLADNYLTAFQGLFNAINTIESDSGRTDPMGLVVLSKVGNATFEVLHLAIDDHFDAQRRRQHQTPVVRHTADLTPW